MTSQLEKAWRRAAALAPEHALALPFAGEQVAVIGTGPAAGIARAYAALREDAAHGATDAPAVDDVPTRAYDRTVLLSRTGDEPAMVELVERLRSEAILAIAIGAPSGSPLDELAGVTVPLVAIDGPGGPDAAFALTAYAVLRHHLTGSTGGVDARAATRAPVPDVSGVRRWVFVGRRVALGLAEAAASTFRRRGASAVGGTPAALAAGDLGVLDATTLVWVFGAENGVDTGDAAMRRVATDPAAELVLALRVADGLGRGAGDR
jgi:hypothetical protein